MNIFKTILIGTVIGTISTFTMAENNPLSVHVLNLQDGLPAPAMSVTLEKSNGLQWQHLNQGKTDRQGQIAALYPDGKALETGIYRITFKTGEWFKLRSVNSFFPEVPVIFEVDGSLKHYHIPLLLSPYGFSTYRGN